MRRLILPLLVVATALIKTNPVSSCSMYKLSQDGKTVVGCNEDAWRTTPHIWFEKGVNENHACCFTGSRSIGPNRYAAQSGMNEHGLTFSRLGAYHPLEQSDKSKKLIEHPDHFLMDVMRKCKNIEEVYAFVDQYDRSCFIADVFVYIEPSGNYLIVEPYQLIRGNNATLVQANFCPSITSENDRRKQNRYKDGLDFLLNGYNTSAEFCRDLSNEMHVCRDKVGDGTLLSSIWDTKNLNVTLYFYHDYSDSVVFHLPDEFSKGDHLLAISSIFPKNDEFQQLANYITPFNQDWIRMVIAFFGFIFLLSALFYGITSLIRKNKSSRTIRLILFVFLALSFCYMFVIATDIYVYYFPAPFVHFNSIWITLSSYIPYTMIALLILVGFLHWRRKYFQSWSKFSFVLLSLNMLMILSLIFPFFYWGLVIS